MWSNFVQYYKDPHLVCRIQEFFGVENHFNKYDKYEESNKIDNFTKKNKRNDMTNKSTKSTNGYLRQENDNTTKDNENKIPQLKNDTGSNDYFKDKKTYTIKNYFWYYLFLFGTELGDEMFYLTFLPFWFWNIDAAVGRKIVLVWAVIMSVGQTLKDVICWPRPSCPPVVRLQKKWSLEYGMPSTHAMIGVAIPFSAVFFTMNKYIYSFPASCIAAILWCTLICVSRIYLGMHTVLDIIAGLILAIVMMILFAPLVNAMDHYLVTNGWIVLTILIISIIIIIYYPCSDKWTPTRGDTALVVSVTAGVHVGAWLNYKTGVLSVPLAPPPYNIMWPSYLMLGKLILRTIFGFCCIIGSKEICKSLTYNIMCAILGVNAKELRQSEDSLKNKNKILVDLIYKYVTCFIIGFDIVYLLPYIFTIIGIERSTFYTDL